MKKIAAVVLALMLALSMTVVAVAETVDMTGTWYASLFGMSVSLELNADNTYVMTIAGMDDTNSGEWAFDGANVTMDPGTEGETAMAYDAAANTFGDESEGLTFTREPVAVFVPAAPVAAEDIAAFAGNWKCSMLSLFGLTVSPEAGGIDLTLSVEGDMVTLTISMGGEGEPATVPATLTDGMLVMLQQGEGEDAVSYTAQLLEDGTIAVGMTIFGETATFYMEKAE